MTILRRIAICLGLLASFAGGPVWAKDINIAVRSDGAWDFFKQVLEKAVEGTDYKLVTQTDLPQPRVEAMLDQGELDFHVFVGGAARNARWTQIPVGLTGGYIGKRVLLVQQKDLPKFAAIHSLDDLKASGLAGGFGQGWTDIDIWKANGLAYAERAGKWELIYRQIGAPDHGIDYFSRGVLEAIPELKGLSDIPGLVLEPHLLLVYDADWTFYASKKVPADLVALVRKRLEQMKADGSLEKMFKAQTKWADAIAASHLDGRTVITLKMP